MRREKTCTISETMPTAGRKMMYTSGWPKIQNKCCHNSGLPPYSDSKKWKPKLRSSTKKILAVVSGGMANKTANDVTRIAQMNSGIRLIDMPGARILKIETMKFAAPAVDAILRK